MKKLCFITSSRADYGTIEILIDQALKSKKLKSNLVITGSHSNSIFGSDTEIKRKKRLSIFKIPIKSNKNFYIFLPSKGGFELSKRIFNNIVSGPGSEENFRPVVTLCKD